MQNPIILIALMAFIASAQDCGITVQDCDSPGGIMVSFNPDHCEYCSYCDQFVYATLECFRRDEWNHLTVYNLITDPSGTQQIFSQFQKYFRTHNCTVRFATTAELITSHDCSLVMPSDPDYASIEAADHNRANGISNVVVLGICPDNNLFGMCQYTLRNDDYITRIVETSFSLDGTTIDFATNTTIAPGAVVTVTADDPGLSQSGQGCYIYGNDGDIPFFRYKCFHFSL